MLPQKILKSDCFERLILVHIFNLQNTYFNTSKCTCPIVQVNDLHVPLKTAMSPKFSIAITKCLPVVYYGYLHAVYNGYLQSTMAILSQLWLPAVYYGYL